MTSVANVPASFIRLVLAAKIIYLYHRIYVEAFEWTTCCLRLLKTSDLYISTHTELLHRNANKTAVIFLMNLEHKSFVFSVNYDPVTLLHTYTLWSSLLSNKASQDTWIEFLTPYTQHSEFSTFLYFEVKILRKCNDGSSNVWASASCSQQFYFGFIVRFITRTSRTRAVI